MTFLRIRARLAWQNHLHVIVGRVDDPRLPQSLSVDAVLIADTCHELTAPAPVLDALSLCVPERGWWSSTADHASVVLTTMVT